MNMDEFYYEKNIKEFIEDEDEFEESYGNIRDDELREDTEV